MCMKVGLTEQSTIGFSMVSSIPAILFISLTISVSRCQETVKSSVVTFTGSAADKIVELISVSRKCKQRPDSKPVVTLRPVVTPKQVVRTKPVVKTTPVVITTTRSVVTTTPKSMENPDPACKVSRPSDCSALIGTKCKSGVYKIYPDKSPGFKVYCDMETDGGGWTVFQRRINGKTDFYREWEPYKRGFGNLTEEFWLGNEFIHQLSAQGNYILRITLEDFENKKRFAEYKKFYVGDEKSGYKLTTTGYHGNAGEAMVYFANGQKFSTKDRDNDISSTTNCAEYYKGAWWYKSCHQSNLNGLYLKGSNKSYAVGVVWYPWHGYNYSLNSTSMMLRRA